MKLIKVFVLLPQCLNAVSVTTASDTQESLVLYLAGTTNGGRNKPWIRKPTATLSGTGNY